MRFPRVASAVMSATGFEADLVFSPVVEHLVSERMRRAGVHDEGAYLAMLHGDSGELERIAEGIAVPETSLFRYPDSFEFLVRRLRERMRAGKARLAMMSIGCATGEEAASMAIAAVVAGWPVERVRIDAIDRSAHALARAREGWFPVRVASRLPDWARRWLVEDDGGLRLVAPLQGIIRHRQADVRTLPITDYAGTDVIFCRNVLIYLGGAARQELLGWIQAVLATDGLLLVGHAETGTASLHAALDAVDAPRCFALERRESPARRPVAPAPAARLRPAPRSAPASPAPARPRPRTAGSPPPAANASRAGAPRATPSSGPTGVAATFDEARVLADAGDLAAARAMIERLMVESGPSGEGLELLGCIHVAQGELRSAHECFFRAVYLQPEREQALLQLALICDRQGDAVQAANYRARARRVHREEAAS